MQRDRRCPEVLAELARDAARLGLPRASRMLAELALQRATMRAQRVVVVGTDELPRVPRIVHRADDAQDVALEDAAE